MRMRYMAVLWCALVLVAAIPYLAEAHEVYVLEPHEVREALAEPMPDFLGVIFDNFGQFMFWGLVIGGVILAVFLLSVVVPVERTVDPLLLKLKRFAPEIMQATLGISFLASGWYNAVFGIELSMEDAFGAGAPLLRIVFLAVGACILFGIYPRIASVAAFLIFAALAVRYGFYMLNYGTYLGESLAVALFGGGYTIVSLGFRKKKFHAFEEVIAHNFHKYKFLVLRIVFGASLIFASLYAKFFHAALAIETVEKYRLTDYFHFDPLFLVLGAMLTELLIGFFFIIGFEVRFVSLVFLAFLALSLCFFGEAVWPHFILIGTALAMFTHGYDRYTLTAHLVKRKDLEPVG